MTKAVAKYIEQAAQKLYDARDAAPADDKALWAELDTKAGDLSRWGAGVSSGEERAAAREMAADMYGENGNG